MGMSEANDLPFRAGLQQAEISFAVKRGQLFAVVICQPVIGRTQIKPVQRQRQAQRFIQAIDEANPVAKTLCKSFQIAVRQLDRQRNEQAIVFLRCLGESRAAL